NGNASGIQRKENKELSPGFEDASAFYIHEVKANETLWSLTYNLFKDRITGTVTKEIYETQYVPFYQEDIRQLNHLVGDGLKAGMKLKIPARTIPINKVVEEHDTKKLSNYGVDDYLSEAKAIGFKVLGVREYADPKMYRLYHSFGPRYLLSGSKEQWAMLFSGITAHKYRALVTPFIDSALNIGSFTTPNADDSRQEYGTMKVGISRAPNYIELMEFLKGMYNVGDKIEQMAGGKSNIGNLFIYGSAELNKFIATYQPALIEAFSLEADQGMFLKDQIGPIASISADIRTTMIESAFGSIFRGIVRMEKVSKTDDKVQNSWTSDLCIKNAMKSGQLIKTVLMIKEDATNRNMKIADMVFNSIIPFIKYGDKTPIIVDGVKEIYMELIERVLSIDIGRGKSIAEINDSLKGKLSVSLSALSEFGKKVKYPIINKDQAKDILNSFVSGLV
ncbi:MAG TPA: LysM peptidoglycan-binding domain-containing protein, partial [Cytophagaceae bacterium]|nr:LysM peptidoglycan-binding domain-containing protein [Cytophagaceae bacterium]